MSVHSKFQLFFLHFAGGNCYSYKFLEKYFDSKYELHAIELPGRGKRLGEDLIRDRKGAIDDYFQQIKQLRNGNPFLVYGHSMGALLGLSVVKRLEEITDFPIAFIPTGNAGPMPNNGESQRYLLNDDDFKSELRSLGGIPEEVLVEDELYDFFSPILRADFEVLEKLDNFMEGEIIDTPIHALVGADEKSAKNVENWGQFTTDSFDYQIMTGNHFFIYDHDQNVAQIIMDHFTGFTC